MERSNPGGDRAPDGSKREPLVILNPPKVPGSGPPCHRDGGPTQKTGSCYTCLLCGETTGCG